MRYLITGADAATGREQTLIVEAVDDHEALTKARQGGVLPYKVVQEELAEEAAAPVRTTAPLPPTERAPLPKASKLLAPVWRWLRRNPIQNAVVGILIVAGVVWVVVAHQRSQEELLTPLRSTEFVLPAQVEREMRADYYAKNMSAAWLADFDEQMRLYESADAEWWARFNQAPSDQKDRMLSERLARQAAAERANPGVEHVRKLNEIVRAILQEMRL